LLASRVSCEPRLVNMEAMELEVCSESEAVGELWHEVERAGIDDVELRNDNCVWWLLDMVLVANGADMVGVVEEVGLELTDDGADDGADDDDDDDDDDDETLGVIPSSREASGRERLRGASEHSEALPLLIHRLQGRPLLQAFLAFLHCIHACGTRRCATNHP
jgi:hypothetical protein